MPISIKRNRQVFDEAGTAYFVGDLIYAVSDSTKIYSVTNCEEKVYVEVAEVHQNRHVVRRMSDELVGRPHLTKEQRFENMLWPEKLVKGEYDSGFTGFISQNPHVEGNHFVSLAEVIEERKKKETLSHEERKYYLNLGIQFAEIIALIHEGEHVIGTLSPDKFWVSEAGGVYSFLTYQFSYENVNAFDSPQYVAPEWLSQRNRERIIFDQKSDSFLYALILFQLLTGKYPFVSDRDISEVKKEELWEQMVDGKSLYFWEDANIMNTIEEALQGVNSEVEALFKRTFDYCGDEEYDESRASIEEWLQALKEGNN